MKPRRNGHRPWAESSRARHNIVSRSNVEPDRICTTRHDFGHVHQSRVDLQLFIILMMMLLLYELTYILSLLGSFFCWERWTAMTSVAWSWWKVSDSVLGWVGIESRQRGECTMWGRRVYERLVAKGTSYAGPIHGQSGPAQRSSQVQEGLRIAHCENTQKPFLLRLDLMRRQPIPFLWFNHWASVTVTVIPSLLTYTPIFHGWGSFYLTSKSQNITEPPLQKLPPDSHLPWPHMHTHALSTVDSQICLRSFPLIPSSPSLTISEVWNIRTDAICTAGWFFLSGIPNWCWMAHRPECIMFQVWLAKLQSCVWSLGICQSFIVSDSLCRCLEKSRLLSCFCRTGEETKSSKPCLHDTSPYSWFSRKCLHITSLLISKKMLADTRLK